MSGTEIVIVTVFATLRARRTLSSWQGGYYQAEAKGKQLHHHHHFCLSLSVTSINRKMKLRSLMLSRET